MLILIVNLIRSFFGFCPHKWSKWSTDFIKFGFEEYQRKVCLKCGKIKQRSIGWYDQNYGKESEEKDYEEDDYEELYNRN